MNANAFLDQKRERPDYGPSMRIFYEDLLRDPGRVLADLCGLNSVSFEPGMAAPYQSDATNTFRSALGSSTTDPKLFRRQKIDASNANKWASVELPKPMMKETREVASAYGYELPV